MSMIQRRCPFCGTETKIEVNPSSLSAYNSGVNIMQCFGDKNSFEREAIISGMCFKCQEETFGKPLPEHEAEWGSPLGDCEVCGRTLYDKHSLMSNGNYKCKSCYAVYSRTSEGGLICVSE